LEVSTPFDVDGQSFGAVRVAISTLLLKEEISGAVTRNVAVATGVVVAAFFLSLFFATWLLAPIEMLRRELGRIRPGDGEPPLDLRNEADVSRIAEFFSSMSQKLAEERSMREGDSGWLSTMLGGLSDAVVVVSGDGVVLSLNAPAEGLLGRSREDLQGKPLSELIPSEHPVAEIVTKALRAGGAVGPVHVKLDHGDRTVAYVLTAQVLRDASGISGVMVSARDMEKLSRLGSHLSYSQKLAALGKLTSGVAHEIKNPLNAMVIHVALLRERLARAGPDTQASLDTLDQEIRRLDRVIQGFLRFTRPEDLQLTAIELEELLDEVVRLVSAEARAGSIEIQTEVTENLPPVYGDRELLQQVFLNLVRNACEAMPEGGELKLQARKGDAEVEVEVSDRGIGIPEDRLDQIFDLYMTTKTGGSGIGLSMVYRIIQLHGGEITVESKEGEGSSFTVRLPEVPG
jgi:PAS domain S-box-containing protein